jgi:membrane protease YdiL (CAAX protease family)
LPTSDSSPYGKILKSGFGVAADFKALVYCYVQASLAEELLFHGIFGKRLINALGFSMGNILQSLLFWLMHLLIFRLATGEWFSFLQIITFVTSFGLGLVMGYVNVRNSGESIAPSWILHGSVDFVSFLTLAILWPA